MSGKRWNHNYTSKATGAIISNFVSAVPALCSHPNSTDRIYCSGVEKNSIYFLLKLANRMKICILSDRNQMKHDKPVKAATWTCQSRTWQWVRWDRPWETNHTHCLAGLAAREIKGRARGASLRGLGLTWRGLAWSAGGLFIDTSTYLSCIGFIMEKFYGDTLYWLEKDWLVFKVTGFITQKRWFWS